MFMFWYGTISWTFNALIKNELRLSAVAHIFSSGCRHGPWGPDVSSLSVCWYWLGPACKAWLAHYIKNPPLQTFISPVRDVCVLRGLDGDVFVQSKCPPHLQGWVLISGLSVHYMRNVLGQKHMLGEIMPI